MLLFQNFKKRLTKKKRKVQTRNGRVFQTFGQLKSKNLVHIKRFNSDSLELGCYRNVTMHCSFSDYCTFAESTYMHDMSHQKLL